MMTRTATAQARWLTPGLALFWLLFGWYALTSGGHTYTSDEETMLAVAEGLVERGSFALEPDFLMNYAADSPDGLRYSRYGPGYSLAMVPFLVLGQTMAVWAPSYAEDFVVRLGLLLLPALVTAATGTLLYAWVRSLGFGVRIALLVGLIYGLATLAAPYSRTLFAEPPATLLLVLCAYAVQCRSWRWWLVAGLAAGAAVAVKAQVLLALPFIALYALLVCARDGWHTLPGRLGMGLLGVVLPLGLLLFYQAALFGDPLTTGYGGLNPTGVFDSPWREGLLGLTFSTGKGLFVFAPVLLLGVLGAAFRFRQQGREALLALALLGAHLAFYSPILYWHGDGSWGPRYLVFVVPFLCLPLAGLLAAIAAARNRLAGGLVAALVVVSFGIQLLPVVANMNTYMQLSDNQYVRHFTPAQSPIVGHARLWGERLSAWWLRVDPPSGVVVLRDGFSYSEGDRAARELLPRWTYADAAMTLHLPHVAPVEGRLVVGDHRPWPLERAQFGLLLHGQPFEAVQRTDVTGEGVVWELRFMLPADTLAQPEVPLTLRSDTWNPTRDTEDNPRNEDLGLLLQEASFIQDGTPLTLREALPIPTVPDGRRALWLWYYDTPHQHMLDMWLWYILVANLPAATLVWLLGFLALPAAVALGVGLRGTLRHLRAPPAAGSRPAYDTRRPYVS